MCATMAETTFRKPISQLRSARLLIVSVGVVHRMPDLMQVADLRGVCRFQADLRLPPTVRSEARREQVQQLIQQLGLQKVSHAACPCLWGVCSGLRPSQCSAATHSWVLPSLSEEVAWFQALHGSGLVHPNRHKVADRCSDC